MNPFEHHGIGHLSPSALNLFIEQPGIWAYRYLGRMKDAGSPSMWRGNAVEAGYVAYLTNHPNPLEMALRNYWLNVEENKAYGEDASKQAGFIDPMLKQCLMWTPPSTLVASQIKVELALGDLPIPVVGYVDLEFEGMDTDLKTTLRVPSKPSSSHVRQVAFYRAARDRAGSLFYVSDKKCAYFEVTDEMMGPALAELSDAAQKLSRLLGAFNNTEDIMAALPIDYENYRAPKRGAIGAVSAADDFGIVELVDVNS